MKNILIIFILISPVWVLAQEEPVCGEAPSGFSTDPEAPYNPDSECSTVVNNFDWRTSRWYAPFYLGRESDDYIPSPFFNNGNLAIPEIYRTDTYNGKDFEVEDGWELIMDGITTQQGNQEESTIVYLALYNKYTGILRIFGAHHDIGDFDYAVVKLDFDQTGNNQMTGLFHPTEQIAQPLDQKSIQELQRNSKLTDVSQVQFFYADFPIGYDPCTCFSNQLGTINVEFQVVNDRKIDLYGRAVSISRTLEEVAGGQVALNEDFLNNISTNNGQRPDAGSQVFNTLGQLELYYEGLKDEEAKYNEQYEAILKVKKNLELAATLVSAVGIIGGTIVTAGTTTSLVLVNGVYQVVSNTDVPKIFKAAKQAKLLEKPLLGLAKYTDIYAGSIKKKKAAAASAAAAVGATRIISSEMVFQGNIKNISYRGGFGFYIPGQPLNNNQNCSSPYYPMYNEVLGRFALLETPKVDYVREAVNQNGSVVEINKFQFDSESFKYMFNPAANINLDNTKIFAGLVINGATRSFCEEGQNIILNNLSKVESLSGPIDSENNLLTYTTPFVPVECLEQVISQIKHQPLSCGFEANVSLRLIIMYDYDATGSDGDRIQNFEIITYPVQKVPKSVSQVDPPITNENGAIPYNTTIGTTNYAVTQTVHAWETITIDGDLSTDNGVEVEISAPTIIVKGGRISGNIRLLERLTPFSNCAPIGQFPHQNLESYCGNESTYQANQPKYPDITAPPITEKPKTPVTFQAYPNPFTNTFNIEFELEAEGETSLVVYDALGRVVETVLMNDNLMSGSHQYQIGGENLESGLYYATLQHSGGTQTIKIIKQ